ncbi:unnamed protein product [Acanthosepion pharaonis]|uniref:Tyrosine-protein phosphatase domain-containing protein n=1 Tax=Acanthosepion pharaonis TaxID=158019 RepID=A0A812CAF1_ACAPH|nr:unnamed protein product [Sepia pharaonis]
MEMVAKKDAIVFILRNAHLYHVRVLMGGREMVAMKNALLANLVMIVRSHVIVLTIPKRHGRCPDGKCEHGYTGDKCQTPCPRGRNGTFCKEGCHCSDLRYCTSTSCTCAAGWMGKGCNEECPSGEFGYYCQETCHCADNSKCNKTDGRCPDGKCELGYTGDNCQTPCPRGRNGTFCKEGCHCSDLRYCTSISCPCAAGWMGYGCNKECPSGKFGYYCQGTCHCVDNTKCNKTDGRCPDGKCRPGYRGDKCQTRCPRGRYGNGCREGCHCRDLIYCKYQSCGGCADGWMGNGCNEACPHGRNGTSCRKGCHCKYPGYCTSISCTCAAGWMGNGCNEECDDGTFGDGCQLKCHCADDLQCRHIDGKCLDGKCAVGYKGENCQQVDLNLILPIALVPLLVIFIIIALVIYFRRKNSKRRNHQVKEPSGNIIPMETGILQETNPEILREGYIQAENVYQNVVVLTKDNFLSYVQQKKMEEDPFSDDFLNLDKHAEYSCETGKLSENIRKNRYKTLLPYDYSRVVLHSDGTSSADYINASYINVGDNYIATQGPLEGTIEDFWKMIWQEKCNTIVMLTEIMENGKLKCCVYWPKLNEIENHGKFQIQCVQEKHSMVYIYRILAIKKLFLLYFLINFTFYFFLVKSIFFPCPHPGVYLFIFFLVRPFSSPFFFYLSICFYFY